MFGLVKYDYTASKNFLVYSFISCGTNGLIPKICKFSLIGKNIYNFGFGDLNTETGEIDDVVESRNGDIEIIMGTVGSIIYDFTNIIPEALIFIEGNKAAKTRLYQLQIGRYWHQVNLIFEVWGLKNDHWELFRKGVNYDAFVGRRKGA